MRGLSLLILLFTSLGIADPDPHMAETKTQIELENALGRIIPPQQFLVQVSADVTQRLQRRLVEGESLVNPNGQKTKRPEPMPGFMPEAVSLTETQAPTERQIFRVVETPVLESVRVRVDFDERVNPDRILRAKNIVKDYITSHFSGQAEAIFGRLPMISADPNIPMPKEPSALESFFKQYWPWILTAIGGWFLFMTFRKPSGSVQSVPRIITKRVRKVLSNPAAALGIIPSGGESPIPVVERKKILLDKFLRKSDSFRLYYLSLDEEKRNELAGLLHGPAFDSLMDGLGIFRTPGQEVQPGSEEDVLDIHEREFDDYGRARDWQEQQFFGFLHQLSNDQLNTLLTHASPLAACVMLRFLKPAQSAYVLDNMSPARRMEIFAEVPQVQVAALHDLAAIEKEIRVSAMRMPRALFGSPKEDADYWGKVLSESDQQDGILKDLEKTNPELAPNLKQFRFKLEDVMKLKSNILDKVLGDVDNEELSMALVTLPEKLAEQILSKLGGRRRDLVAGQVLANRDAPPTQTRPARLSLTKRFREAMAA